MKKNVLIRDKDLEVIAEKHYGRETLWKSNKGLRTVFVFL